MKINRKFRLKLKVAKDISYERGRKSAMREFKTSLKKLSEQTKSAIIELEGAHESNINMLMRKEKEFADLCDELKTKRDKIDESLKNIRHYEAESMVAKERLKSMFNSEKYNKFQALNKEVDNLEYNVIQAVKEAQKHGVQ